MARITSPTAQSMLTPAALLLVTCILAGLGWWRGTGVGPQVQTPMFYDDHYVYPRPWTQAQAAPGVPDPAPVAALYGPNRLSQPFISAIDNLALIELWLAGPAGSEVEISLAAENGPAYTGHVSLVAGDGRRYRFSFPPVAPARGRRFTLTLAAPRATADQPVVARAVGGDRLGGSLLLNEYSRPGNLELYSYGRGLPGRWWLDALAEQFVPAVFGIRLQQYKPVMLKGAAFPALLLLTAFLTTAFLVLSAVEVKRRLPGRQAPAATLTLTTAGWGLSIVLAAFLVWQLASGRLLLPGPISTVPLQAQTSPIALAPAPDGRLRLAHDFSQTLWTAARRPEARFISTALLDGLPAVRVPAVSALEYPLTVPPGGRLRLGLLVRDGSGLRFTVLLAGQTLHTRVVDVAGGVTWLDLDLQPWAGQPGPLTLQTEASGDSPTGFWIMPQLLTSAGWLLPDPLPADFPAQPAAYRFGDTVELIGYQVEEGVERIVVTLYWRPLAHSDRHAAVFVHLLDESGNLVAQHDGQPVGGAYPLPAWQAGVIIGDEHVVALRAGFPAGSYQLAVGLYDPVSLARWPVTGPDGQLLPDGRAFLR